jgi:DNA-directed RNA polymerase specialized sigma subunit
MLDSGHNIKRWLQAVAEELEESTGRRPSPEELADCLGMTAEELSTLGGESSARPVTDLVDCVCKDCQDESAESGPTLDLPARLSVCPTAPPEPDLARSIRDRANQLPPLHRKVLLLYYFENLRLPEIAEACGEPEPLIAQIQVECIQAIRQAMQARAGRTD